MRFLKKPISIKKIRMYKNNLKSEGFIITNKQDFTSKSGVIKSSYLENMLDLGLSSSVTNLKGGYFYSNKDNGNTSNEYFHYINNNVVNLDLSSKKLNFSFGVRSALPLICFCTKFLFFLSINKSTIK